MSTFLKNKNLNHQFKNHIELQICAVYIYKLQIKIT
jgi:hypothetical protein